MEAITDVFKNKVVETLNAQRLNFGGSDKAFSNVYGINNAVYARIKKGEREGLLSESKWLQLGRMLDIKLNCPDWQIVRTDVFNMIEEDILFCKKHSKSLIFADNCGIGKTVTAKYLAKTQKNVFYIDCTQCKKETQLIRALARAVGVEIKGKLDDIKENTKYYLTLLDKPVVIIDEAGELRLEAFGLLQEYWNATEGFCGWYAMGGNAFRRKITKGVEDDKDFYAEIFSRFSEKFNSIVPKETTPKLLFYKKLIADIILPNLKNKSLLNELVNRSIIDKENGVITGLRRVQTLLLLKDVA